MTPEALLWVAIVLKFATGSVLIGAGLYGRLLVRRFRRDQRALAAALAADAQIQAWRAERRARRAAELRAWDADFAALLPPPPLCTSTEHNHVENIRLGSGTIEQICVIRPPYSSGGAVLAPGEHVIGISSAEAVASLQALAKMWARRQ